MWIWVFVDLGRREPTLLNQDLSGNVLFPRLKTQAFVEVPTFWLSGNQHTRDAMFVGTLSS